MKKGIALLINLLLTVLAMGQLSNTYKYPVFANGGMRIGSNGTKVDSIKLIDGKLYFYTPTKWISTDTLSGLVDITPRFPSSQLFVNDAIIGKKTRTINFQGFRAGGDSIKSNITIGAALGPQNQLWKNYNFTIGNGSVADGYMSTSIGTQSLSGANDAVAFGNETVTGKRRYESPNLTFGNDVGGNYIEILGTSYGGDQSSYFYAAVDSGAYSYAQRAFWNYPIFWTSNATRDYPSGGANSLGLNPLRCTAVSYDSGTNKTKIHYADSLLAPSAATWITSCSRGVPGTGNVSGGRWSSTIGEAAISLGYQTKSWNTYTLSTGYNTKAFGSASASFNENTLASGQAASAFGYNTTASGNYSSVFGNDNLVSGVGSIAFGIDVTLTEPYQLGYNSVEKFARNGDIQAGLLTTKVSNTTTGGASGTLFKLNFNTTYTATTQYSIIQYGGTVGTVGESGSGDIKWSIWLGAKYVIDSCNLISNRIYYTGTDLIVGQKIAMSTYTTSAMTTETTSPGGLAYNQTYYIREVGTLSDGKFATLAPTAAGAEVNITSFNASHYHTFARVSFVGNTQTSFGRTFVNAGDDVGNGTTTGIRCVLVTTDYLGLSRYRPQIYLYGLANRSLRCATTTNYVQVSSE